ncbi:MAG: mannose-1-phosphate guanylyltransferase [Bacteroidota bacterium]
MSNNFCVIMAGGTGTRFWPLSTQKKPKQFLDILNTGSSLLQLTFERFKQVCPIENIFVVTNELYGQLVKEQLPALSENQILVEPEKKNTAPCIAYANHKIKTINPKANIVVTPSDHLILKENEFVEVIKNGLQFTQNNDALLTLGITPHRPETGYGYIQIDPDKKAKENSNIFKVKTFTEKPNLDLAKKFYESGEYYWNSGVFIWSLDSIDRAFNSYLPNIDKLFAKGGNKYNTEEEQEFINEVYFQSNSISIDYGIMEKADNVFVYTSDFGWADLGTWGSLQEFLNKDEQGNSVTGDNILLYDVKDSIINISKGKIAVIKGLENYIVVDSEDKLLIYKKNDEQEIKEVVETIKKEKGYEYI